MSGLSGKGTLGKRAIIRRRLTSAFFYNFVSRDHWRTNGNSRARSLQDHWMGSRSVYLATHHEFKSCNAGAIFLKISTNFPFLKRFKKTKCPAFPQHIFDSSHPPLLFLCLVDLWGRNGNSRVSTSELVDWERNGIISPHLTKQAAIQKQCPENSYQVPMH